MIINYGRLPASTQCKMHLSSGRTHHTANCLILPETEDKHGIFYAVKLNFLNLCQQARQFNTSHLCMDGTVANCGRVIYFQEQCEKKLKNVLHIL